MVWWVKLQPIGLGIETITVMIQPVVILMLLTMAIIPLVGAQFRGIGILATIIFLPRIYLALENVISTDNPKATASILSISLREDLGNGQYGPEIIEQSSAESELYFSDKPLYDLDQTLNEAEQAGMYLKVVLLDKNDHIYKKINDYGSFVIAGDDNEDGVYGCDPGNSSLCLNQARTLNKTRWLQEAYYRYLQARFGYSSHIHSWEFTNEGDPGSLAHWQTTDELGKTLSCRVFGVPVYRTDLQKVYFRPS